MKAVNDLNFVMENFILMASLIIVSCSDNSPWYDILYFVLLVSFILLYCIYYLGIEFCLHLKLVI